MQKDKKRLVLQVSSYSILIAWLLRMSLGEPFILNSLILLILQLSLLVDLKAGEHTSRLMMWQRTVLLGGGVALICLIDWGGQGVVPILKTMSRLLLIACLTTTFIKRKELKTKELQPMDVWMPPMWSLMIGFLFFLFSKAHEEFIIRRSWVVIGMVVLFISIWHKEKQKENPEIRYVLHSKGYLKMMVGMIGVTLLMVTYVPVPTVLPGSEWVQKQMKALRKVGSLSENIETHLSRNPLQSQSVVLTVRADQPLYLRRRAYTLYDHGTWRVKEEQKKSWTPLDGEGTYREYILFRMLLQEIEAGEVYIEEFKETYKAQLKLPLAKEKRHLAVVKESKVPTSYLSVNGVTGIDLQEIKKARQKELDVNEIKEMPSHVGYIGRLENLYFINLSTPMHKAYTIEYVDYELEEGTREKALLEKLTPNELTHLWIEAYDQSYELGRKMIERGKSGYLDDAFYQLYTQVPQEIEGLLASYARELTKGYKSELEQTKAICYALKESGTYTYQLGAPYMDLKRDPIVDFLFYGKQGICQDFASSMVLLCRSIGLPARYVEGYRPLEKGVMPDEYIVREKDAHAFVEVYLTGYGWMTFDPTTGIQAEVGSIVEGTLNWGPFTFTKIQGLGVLGGIAIGFGIWQCIIKKRLNDYRRRKVWKEPPEVILQAFIHQTLQLLEQKGYKKEEDETLYEFGERVGEEGLKIRPILTIYEAYMYGQQMPTLENLEEVAACYEELVQKKKQQNKKTHEASGGFIEG